MSISKQEVVLGGMSTILLALKLWSPWAILLPVVTAFLWAYGGSGHGKLWRRLGVPLSAVAFTIVLLGFHWLYLLTIPVGFAILCLGDGYKSIYPYDDGSWLGRQVYRLGLSDYCGGLLTKLLVVCLLQVAWLPIII